MRSLTSQTLVNERVHFKRKNLLFRGGTVGVKRFPADSLSESVTLTVGRDRKTQISLRTNQISLALDFCPYLMVDQFVFINVSN